MTEENKNLKKELNDTKTKLQRALEERTGALYDRHVTSEELRKARKRELVLQGQIQHLQNRIFFLESNSQ